MERLILRAETPEEADVWHTKIERIAGGWNFRVPKQDEYDEQVRELERRQWGPDEDDDDRIRMRDMDHTGEGDSEIDQLFESLAERDAEPE